MHSTPVSFKQRLHAVEMSPEAKASGNAKESALAAALLGKTLDARRHWEAGRKDDAERLIASAEALIAEARV